MRMRSEPWWMMAVGVVMASGAVRLAFAQVEWTTPMPYRVAVEARSVAGQTVNTPVGAAVDFKAIFHANDIAGRVDWNSVRVVSAGDSTEALPYTITGDYHVEDSGVIWWRMRDPSVTTYYIYFDTLANGRHQPREVIGLVGIGDTFHYNDGRPGFAGAAALHSQFWHLDWDGDGLRDLIGFAHRPYEYGHERAYPETGRKDWWRDLEGDIGNAVFFYKNIGEPGKPLFAPRYRLKAADGAWLRTEALGQNMFPADWDGDGDVDFYGMGRGNALLLWENTGERDANGLWLLRQPVTIATLDAKSDFRENMQEVAELPSPFSFRSIQRLDWDNDGVMDLLASYRRTNRVRRVDPKQGVMPYGAGLLIFEVFINTGTNDSPVYAKPFVVRDERAMPIHAHSYATGGAAYVDWDGDGDNDFLYHDMGDNPTEGERLMFAENRGTLDSPLFSMPISILNVKDSPQAIDWNDDGRLDLIAGSEFFENVNPRSDGTIRPRRNAIGTRLPHMTGFPKLASRGPAQQINPPIITYFTTSVDWDGDGDLDLVSGYQNHVMLYRNVGTTLEPVFERGVKIESDGKPINMVNWLDPQADEPTTWGPQGPSEPIYGWLVPTVADWNGDGKPDLFITSQRWQTVYFENVGTRSEPKLARGREVRCDGNPYEFSWRSRVAIGDLDGDGEPELVVSSDRDNTFYTYTRTADSLSDPEALNLTLGEPLMQDDGTPVKGWYGSQNNNGDNHGALVDWDGDGDLDLMNGSIWAVWHYENVGTKTKPVFVNRGRFEAGGKPIHTFNHAGSFDAADWNGDGRLDLVMGAECPSDSPFGGVLHLFDRAFIENRLPVTTVGGVETKKQ